MNDVNDFCDEIIRSEQAKHDYAWEERRKERASKHLNERKATRALSQEREIKCNQCNDTGIGACDCPIEF